jgi:hypothetical protein
MFIDRNLDPTQRDSYREFIKILVALKQREVPPLVEIHRTIAASESGKWVIHSIEEWKRRFCNAFSELVGESDIKIEVFIWHRMHDRYLISDICGILAPNGFDISKNPAETTTWTSVSRFDRDEIAREYDPACNRPNFVDKFEIK